MSEPLPPSAVFLQSEGTQEDFQAFWEKDPIGAAQFATGVAVAQEAPFEGLEELQHLLDSGASVEEQQERLRDFARRSTEVFRFVESTEAVRKAKSGEFGWTTS